MSLKQDNEALEEAIFWGPASATLHLYGVAETRKRHTKEEFDEALRYYNDRFKQFPTLQIKETYDEV